MSSFIRGVLTGSRDYFWCKQSWRTGVDSIEHPCPDPTAAELQAREEDAPLGGRGKSVGEMKMKMYSFALLAMAFTTVAVSGEPIDLGCNARGPLAALKGSAAFRKAFGEANPANFLGSVYDVNGQQLSPGSFKALHCPLFIDSNAEPSASASTAILRAEAGVRAAEPEEQSIAADQNKPIMVLAAAGVVAQFPQPAILNPATQERLQAAPKAEARKAQDRRGATAARGLGLKNQQTQPGISKPSQELTPRALAVPSPKQIVEKRAQSSSVAQSQKSLVWSVAEATGLIRQARTGGSAGLPEFNPVMVLFDFAALFAAVLAFCLMVAYRPGLRLAPVQNRADLYRAVMDGVDLQSQQRVHLAPKRASSVPAAASAMMLGIGH
jgi:hypothetical protein